MKRLAIKKYTVPVIALMMGSGWIFYPGKTGTPPLVVTPVSTIAATSNTPVKTTPAQIKDNRTISIVRH